MGDKRVSTEYDDEQMRAFTLGVLNDLQALEMMLDGGMFEEDARRIGAEQEMFLVDSSMHPAPLAIEVIEDAKDDRLTTEIGRFNLEANLTPRDFSGCCLRLMEDELNETIDIVRRSAGKFDADVPVEDDAGRLIGIVSHRDLIELLVLGKSGSAAAMVVRDIMKTDLVTVSPETPTLDALELMRERSIGCLPVIRDERLVGLVTAYDFLTVSSKLLEERLSGMAVAKGAAE